MENAPENQDQPTPTNLLENAASKPIVLPLTITKQVYHDMFVSAHRYCDTIRLNFASVIPISQDNNVTCGTQIILPINGLDQMLEILIQLRQAIIGNVSVDATPQTDAPAQS